MSATEICDCGRYVPAASGGPCVCSHGESDHPDDGHCAGLVDGAPDPGFPEPFKPGTVYIRPADCSSPWVAAGTVSEDGTATIRPDSPDVLYRVKYAGGSVRVEGYNMPMVDGRPEGSPPPVPMPGLVGPGAGDDVQRIQCHWDGP